MLNNTLVYTKLKKENSFILKATTDLLTKENNEGKTTNFITFLTNATNYNYKNKTLYIFQNNEIKHLTFL